MGAGDKFDAAKDKVSGSAKDAAGKVTGNSELQGEGKAQKLQGKGKDAAESVKDTAKGAAGQAEGAIGGRDDKENQR
ncbi:CsbD family protein [Nesterenkonia natronophila]|uniref:CsbD family protein n=1 Tax=Nesterenkonia natronophila TaxID=2174932 RepID=A0A3A4FCU6_9MICC|nr:CsbD family protein [Nesterenkonia natronophila]RJN32604.1 CsbD family protein [Nesterenkonia natronophila]